MSVEFTTDSALTARYQSILNKSHPHLQTLKTHAWNLFSKQGLPTPKNEAFQYCRRQHLQLEDWNLTQASNTDLEGFKSALFQEKNSPRFLANYDGVELNILQDLPSAFSLETFSASELNDSTLLNQIIGPEDLVESTKDTLAYLNDALFENILVIKVHQFDEDLAKRGLQLNLRQIASQGQFSKIIIHLAPSVEFKIALVEEVFQSEFHHLSVHVKLEENSKLELCRVQTSDEVSSALTHIESIQAANSVYRQIQATMGARIARHSIINLLQEPGAESNFFGVAVLDNKLQSHTHLQLEHQAAHTVSTQRFSQVLLDGSQGSLDGTVVVCRDAQKVTSDQLVKTLMLSENSKAYGKPNLKIYADDVKCAHGNTCGELEDSYLFYLMSRGIAKDRAREILTRGFVEDILDEIHLPILKKAVDDKLLSRLIAKELA